jgi:hypothetical protein
VRKAIVSVFSLVLLLAALVACARPGTGTNAAETVRLEPVNTNGINPFMASVGTDQTGVRAPANVGGTVTAETVGLFGGTNQQGSCDPKKLVDFLQAHPDKANAWASVIGIQASQISSFVSTLTPVVLRSDTRVTNHGFVNGQATTVSSVLQAGTAVLVDKHGQPVTRCACGNPLTAPSTTTSVTFVGPQWSTFQANQITTIQSSTTVINNFTVVDTSTGGTFTRPAGTSGGNDGSVTASAPPSFSATPTPTQPQSPTTPPSPTQASPTQSPTTQSPTTQPPTTPPPTTPTPTAHPRTTQPAPPLPVPAPGTPSPTPASPTPASPTASPTTAAPTTTSPSPSPTQRVRASWSVGDCAIAGNIAQATVVLRNDSPQRHQFKVTVNLVQAGENDTVIDVGPGQTKNGTVRAEAPGMPPGITSCQVVSVVDEHNQRVEQAGTLPTPSPAPTATTPTPSPTETTVSPTPEVTPS